MAPSDTYNRDFYKQLLQGNKKAFKLTEVKFINIPRLQELSIKYIR